MMLYEIPRQAPTCRLNEKDEVERPKRQDKVAAKQRTIRTFENWNSLQVSRFLVGNLGLNRSVFLANLIGKAKVLPDAEEWLFKTVSEIQIETGLGRRAQRTATNKLARLGILEEKRKKSRKTLFRIDFDRLEVFLSEMARRFPFGPRRGVRRLR